MSRSNLEHHLVIYLVFFNYVTDFIGLRDPFWELSYLFRVIILASPSFRKPLIFVLCSKRFLRKWLALDFSLGISCCSYHFHVILAR